MLPATTGDASTVSAGARAATVTWQQVGALAVLGTVLSIASQSFFFGVLNNIYHIPVVLRLFNLPQFANDAFYQSLRDFTSFVWPALALVATPANIFTVFLVAHVASRLLLYIACLMCLLRLGVRSFAALAFAVLLLALGSAFVGYSMIGATGMQIDYFTHTELTYPLLLFALLLASSGRYVLAFAVTAVTFNVNAFVGMWLALVLALLLLMERTTPRKKLKTLLFGGIILLILSAPTALWILRTIRESAGAPSFNYRDFVAYYFPKHFLIQASSPHDLLAFIAACLTGWIAVSQLGPSGRPWRVAFLGFLGMFGLGIAIPLVSVSRLLINLHFLRIDGVLVLLSLLFTVRVAWDAIQSAEGGRTCFAVIALTMIAVGDWRLATIALLLMVSVSMKSGSFLNSPSSIALSCCAMGLLAAVSQIGQRASFQSQYLLAAGLCFLLGLLEDELILVALGALIAAINFPIIGAGAAIGLGLAIQWRTRAKYWVVASAWLSALVAMGLDHTGFKTVLTAAMMALGVTLFLFRDRTGNAIRVLPPKLAATTGLALFSLILLWCAGQRAVTAWIDVRRDPGTQDLRLWKEAQQWARRNTPVQALFLVPADRDGFQLGSYRKVWVDFRQGAGVMWSPAFYTQWMSRYPEVIKLKTHSDFYHYARSHNIEYYVMPRAAASVAYPGESVVYDNARFEICRLNLSSPGE